MPPTRAWAPTSQVRHDGPMPLDRVDIRPLAPTDVAVVESALDLARLHQGNGCYLVAWDGDAPVGHVHLACTDPPELQDLMVLATHRRRGVATALVAAAEREARARSYTTVRLEVSIDALPAQRLYATCGYSEIGMPPRRVQGTVVIRTGPIQVD